jgi:hypothetical protein
MVNRSECKLRGSALVCALALFKTQVLNETPDFQTEEGLGEDAGEHIIN